MGMDDFNDLPDVRDGLTTKERIILYCIDKIQNELGDRNVPTAMLYGRVLEYVDISIDIYIYRAIYLCVYL